MNTKQLNEAELDLRILVAELIVLDNKSFDEIKLKFQKQPMKAILKMTQSFRDAIHEINILYKE